jgi:hypothetical protein
VLSAPIKGNEYKKNIYTGSGTSGLHTVMITPSQHDFENSNSRVQSGIHIGQLDSGSPQPRRNLKSRAVAVKDRINLERIFPDLEKTSSKSSIKSKSSSSRSSPPNSDTGGPKKKVKPM